MTIYYKKNPIPFTSNRIKTLVCQHCADKKVLLRKRKRHTARRVAIASPCYSGGGGPSTKNFFFQSEHVSSQIWCQKIFPLLVGGGVPRQKNFFSSLNMYQAKSGVKKFSLYQWGGGGGGASTKHFFFPV